MARPKKIKDAVETVGLSPVAEASAVEIKKVKKASMVDEPKRNRKAEFDIFLAPNLKFLRKNNGGLTQHELADKTGVLRSAIASYERGMMPRVDYLWLLANHFNVHFDELLLEDMRSPKYKPRGEGNEKTESARVSRKAEQAEGVSQKEAAEYLKEVREWQAKFMGAQERIIALQEKVDGLREALSNAKMAVSA